MTSPSVTFAEFINKKKRTTHNLSNAELNILRPKGKTYKAKSVSKILGNQ